MKTKSKLENGLKRQKKLYTSNICILLELRIVLMFKILKRPMQQYKK